jgi:membrane protease YdiL (CAAX protease family)
MDNTSTEAPLGSSLGGRRSTLIAVGALLLLVAASLFFSLLSRQVGEDSNAGSLAALGGIVVGLVVVWGCQRLLGLGFREIGLRRPQSWPRTLGLGVSVGLVANAVAFVLIAYVFPALFDSPVPDVSRFAGLEGNLVATVTTLLVVWLTSAFPEEVIWRGFLMTRLAKLGGGSAMAWGVALVVTSVHFGAVHFYQGLSGVLATGMAGLLLGLGFLLFGRNLWVPIFAHATMHVMAFGALYMGWL